MTTQANPNDRPQFYLDSYTYPQFVICELTGQIEVNFIDKNSGRVVRHISTSELYQIVQAYHLQQGFKIHGQAKD